MVIGKWKEERGNGPRFWLVWDGARQCGNRAKRRRNPRRSKGRGTPLLNHRSLHSPPCTDLQQQLQFAIS